MGRDGAAPGRLTAAARLWRGGDCADDARRSVDGGVHGVPVRGVRGGAGGGRMGKRLGGAGAPAAPVPRADRRAGARGDEPLRAAVRDGAGDLHVLGAAARRGAHSVRGRRGSHGSREPEAGVMLHSEKTSTRFDANWAAALSYPVRLLTGIILVLVAQENK